MLAGKAKGDGSGKSEVEHKNGVHATEGQKDTFGINGVLEKVVQLKHDLRAEYGNAKWLPEKSFFQLFRTQQKHGPKEWHFRKGTETNFWSARWIR